ncbi:MAG TPA: VCBS repeat-containing protein [bacterium]|nr:VCBS repeat-containing protein [bacterium]HOH85177.1 VCBS repeat-containing protein [bacterium]HQB76681.1 VCBS repeat-containing protein [bacterium]
MKKIYLLVVIVVILFMGCEKKRSLPWLKINGATLYVQGSGMRSYHQGVTYWDHYYLISEPPNPRFDLALPDCPEKLVYKDLNNDGIKDIAVTSRYGNIEGEWEVTKVAFGRKNGTFEKEFQEFPHKLLRERKVKNQRHKSLNYRDI